VKTVFNCSSDPAVFGRQLYLEDKLKERVGLFVQTGKSLVHKRGHCHEIEEQFSDVGVVQFLEPITRDELNAMAVGDHMASTTNDASAMRAERAKMREDRLFELSTVACTK
jgi:hypothetical protein